MATTPGSWPSDGGSLFRASLAEQPLDLQSLTLTSAHFQADVTSSRGTCHGLFTAVHTCSCLGQNIPHTARSKL